MLPKTAALLAPRSRLREGGTVDSAIALVGHLGSGRTALAAAVARQAGGACWFRSATLEATTLTWSGRVLHLLDPGDGPDSQRLALWGADAAVFVVSPLQGIDAATGALWSSCAAAGMPRILAVTHLDAGGADFEEAIAMAQRVFQSDALVPLALPMLDDADQLSGSLDLVAMRIREYGRLGATERPAEPEHLALLDEVRGDLIGEIAARSEGALLQRYLDRGEVPAEDLRAAARVLVAAGELHPALGFAISPAGFGIADLLDLLAACTEPVPPTVERADGSPTEPLGPGSPLAAQVLAVDDGGRALVRVRSGRLASGGAILVPAAGEPRPFTVGGITPPGEAGGLPAVVVEPDVQPWDCLGQGPMPLRLLARPES